MLDRIASLLKSMLDTTRGQTFTQKNHPLMICTRTTPSGMLNDLRQERKTLLAKKEIKSYLLK